MARIPFDLLLGEDAAIDPFDSPGEATVAADNIFSTVADMVAADVETLQDDATYFTNEYLAGGGGGSIYVYRSTGRPATDTGFNILGGGADDYWEATDQSHCDAVKWGMIEGNTPGDDTTNDPIFTAMIATGLTCFFPEGDYRFGASMSITTAGQKIAGSGAENTKLVFTLIDFSTGLDCQTGDFISIADISIEGLVVFGDTAAQMTGIGFTSSANNWSLRNVVVYGCVIGLEISASSGATATGVWARACATGFTMAASCDDCFLDIRVEGVTSNVTSPFTITGCDGLTLRVSYTGAKVPSAAATIDDCNGVTLLSPLLEITTAITVSILNIGATTEVTDIALLGARILTAASTAKVPLVTVDKVDGLTITGSLVKTGVSDEQEITLTANSKNVDIRTSNGGLSTGTRVEPASFSMTQPRQFIADPYLRDGLPTLADTNAVSSEELTITPPGFLRSIKVLGEVGADQNKTTMSLSVAAGDTWISDMSSKRVGFSYWLYVPAIAEAAGMLPTGFVTITGTTPATVTTSAATAIAAIDDWVQVQLDCTFPTVATAVDFDLFANKSATVATADSAAYFTGLLAWEGGDLVSHKVANGVYDTATVGDASTNAVNLWDHAQKSTWVTTGTGVNEARIDLSLSHTQKTTLTSDRTVSFVSVAAADEGIDIKLEVTDAGYDLTILDTNGGGSEWTTRRDNLEALGTAYVVSFMTNSAGVPMYTGAYLAKLT